MFIKKLAAYRIVTFLEMIIITYSSIISWFSMGVRNEIVVILTLFKNNSLKPIKPHRTT
jgi:hypothetical protein